MELVVITLLLEMVQYFVFDHVRGCRTVLLLLLLAQLLLGQCLPGRRLLRSESRFLLMVPGAHHLRLRPPLPDSVVMVDCLENFEVVIVALV